MVTGTVSRAPFPVMDVHPEEPEHEVDDFEGIDANADAHGPNCNTGLKLRGRVKAGVPVVAEPEIPVDLRLMST